jgi:hypothetical protein
MFTEHNGNLSHENYTPTFPANVFSVCSALNMKAAFFSEKSKYIQYITLSQYTEYFYFLSHLHADIHPTTFFFCFLSSEGHSTVFGVENKIVGFLGDEFTRKSKATP